MGFSSRKLLYNTVLSQTLSECGNFLFVGNNFGDIFILSLERLEANNVEYDAKELPNKSPLEPTLIFTVDSKAAVNSLKFHRGFLIVGTVGSIAGYVWNEDKQQIGKKSWEVKIPSAPESIEAADVNFMWVDKASDNLFAGCGDHAVYQISLEDGRMVRTFSGHKDYIHCVTGLENNLYSASEDGTIVFWDIRECKQVGRLEPHTNADLARPEFGKWQGTVSVTNDWLICGGGPRASMWHLRSLECTNILPFPEKVHCSEFLDDLIVIAGEHPFLHQYSFNAEVVAEVPISGASAYSVVLQNEPIKLMSVGGASNFLDIYTNFNYRDLIVKLYSSKKD
ncbi:unnamed protein product [Hermetia illucens]|uniref:THO complex subunit 6 n=1 Tax=Hermetia illucens TaxID=343691 RepID=A0A7R8UH89_HERIL|nr:THO complex subunit 6 [Hermetia illucens]CAD7080840.1 unnamed protein product [Hermetia illucens]